jgi:hypothetical protein
MVDGRMTREHWRRLTEWHLLQFDAETDGTLRPNARTRPALAAMERARALALPFLEAALAGSAAEWAAQGRSEGDWLAQRRALRLMSAAPDAPNAVASNRLVQVVLNLKDAALWPW